MEFVASSKKKTVFRRLSLIVTLHQDVSPSSLLLSLNMLNTVAFANSELNSSTVGILRGHLFRPSFSLFGSRHMWVDASFLVVGSER